MTDDVKTLDLFAPDNGDEAAPIEQHASHAYLGYAVSTVRSRALPEIADGLKPVRVPPRVHAVLQAALDHEVTQEEEA